MDINCLSVFHIGTVWIEDRRLNPLQDFTCRGVFILTVGEPF